MTYTYVRLSAQSPSSGTAAARATTSSRTGPTRTITLTWCSSRLPRGRGTPAATWRTRQRPRARRGQRGHTRGKKGEAGDGERVLGAGNVEDGGQVHHDEVLRATVEFEMIFFFRRQRK